MSSWLCNVFSKRSAFNSGAHEFFRILSGVFMKKVCALLALCLFSSNAMGAGELSLTILQENMNAIFLTLAAALVLLMQLGFAFLEAGICRSKNVVNIMMKNFVDIGLSVFVFWAVGYALLYGNNFSGFFGSSHFFLSGVEDSDYAFVLFQMMFAATAVTITSGAMAERTQFYGYLLSAVIITGLIYPVAASWVWGGANGGQGWLAKMGFIDFAGSSVVHSVGGWVALAGVLIVGSRTGRFDENGNPMVILGHNIAFVAFGGIILWVGWFGFNGGSVVGTDFSLGRAVLVTHMGAAGGLCGIVLLQKLLKQPVLLVTTINGALGGLVSITAGAGTMSPVFALVAGFVGGFVVYFGERLLLKFQVDDVIGAIPVHAFCGVWGTIAAGLFFHGDLFSIDRVLVQMTGIFAILLWAFLTALAVYYVINAIFGLRVERRVERRGLDFSEHYEVAYPEFTDVVTHSKKVAVK